MHNDEIFRRLTEIIRFTLGADDEVPITRDTVALDIDGWDSLSHATLLTMIERKFGIQISNEEGESFGNVGEIADAVAAKVKP